LLIAGYITGGGAWAGSCIYALANGFENQTGWLFVPIVGPWLTLIARDDSQDDCSSSPYFPCWGPRDLLIWSSTAQVTGALLVLASSKTVLVRDTIAISVQPVEIGKRGYGLSINGSF
jgi:hypothetical protein